MSKNFQNPHIFSFSYPRISEMFSSLSVFKGNKCRKEHTKRGPGLLWSAGGQEETSRELGAQPTRYDTEEIFTAKRRGPEPAGQSGEAKDEKPHSHNTSSQFIRIKNVKFISFFFFLTHGSVDIFPARVDLVLKWPWSLLLRPAVCSSVLSGVYSCPNIIIWTGSHKQITCKVRRMFCQK